MIFTNTATWAWRSTTDSNDRFLRETTLASNKCLIHVYHIDLYSLIVTYQIFNVLILHTSLQENSVTPKISQITLQKKACWKAALIFSALKNRLPLAPNKNDPSNTNSFINSRCLYVSRQHFAGNNSFNSM